MPVEKKTQRPAKPLSPTKQIHHAYRTLHLSSSCCPIESPTSITTKSSRHCSRSTTSSPVRRSCSSVVGMSRSPFGIAASCAGASTYRSKSVVFPFQRLVMWSNVLLIRGHRLLRLGEIEVLGEVLLRLDGLQDVAGLAVGELCVGRRHGDDRLGGGWLCDLV